MWRRCVALRCAALCCVVTVNQVKSRTLLIDRPIFLPPPSTFVLPMSLQPVFRLSPQLAIDAGSALDSTGLDSGPVNNTHAMQPRRDTRRSLGAA